LEKVDPGYYPLRTGTKRETVGERQKGTEEKKNREDMAGEAGEQKNHSRRGSLEKENLGPPKPTSAKCKNHSWSTKGGYGPPGPPGPP